jgi:hypothetical protein
METELQHSTNVHSEQVAPPDAKHLLPAVPSLVNARNCNGCWAYSTVGFKEGACSLGFDLEQLGKNPTHGRYGNGDYWSFYCKPKEPCMKPKTGKEYVAAFASRHGR